MNKMLKRAWAEVSLDRICSNYNLIRKKLKKETKIMAVVKADAYGHGAVQVARELEKHAVDYFGVSNIDEALQLRSHGINTPVLIFGYTPIDCVEELVKNNLTQTVFSLEYAKELSKNAKGKLKVHIKIDTGMSRLGFLASSPDSIEEIVAISKMQNLDIEGTFTHFSVSDKPDDDFTSIQYKTFLSITDILSKKGIHFNIKHCCNSAAILNFPEMQLDMVRPGLILYGLIPDVQCKNRDGFLPAMTLKASVAQVKTIDIDSTVSYGRHFVAINQTKVATVAIGYADGYSRLLSGIGEMMVKGEKAKVLGNVCMDLTVIDVTNIENVSSGDEVTIFGDSVTIDEMAEKINTLNYEIICLVGKRVPRLYIKENKVCKIINYIL